jgi:hypothetical protein
MAHHWHEPIHQYFAHHTAHVMVNHAVLPVLPCGERIAALYTLRVFFVTMAVPSATSNPLNKQRAQQFAPADNTWFRWFPQSENPGALCPRCGDLTGSKTGHGVAHFHCNYPMLPLSGGVRGGCCNIMILRSLSCRLPAHAAIHVRAAVTACTHMPCCAHVRAHAH